MSIRECLQVFPDPVLVLLVLLLNWLVDHTLSNDRMTSTPTATSLTSVKTMKSTPTAQSLAEKDGG